MKHPTLRRWLLSEHVRAKEEQSGRSLNDQAANALARQQSKMLEERIGDRAEALPGASVVQLDLTRLARGFRWLVVGLGLLALFAGFGAVRVAVGERELEILLVLMTVLLVPSLMFVLWVFWLAFAPKRTDFSLMTQVVGTLIGSLAKRWLRGPDAECTIQAALAYLTTASGRWAMSILTHSIWLVYLLSAWALLAIQLSVAQYDLGWGTTLLSESFAVSLLQGLAWLPSQLGLVPGNQEQWLAAGRFGVGVEAVRAQWAQFLLGLMAFYGVLPRGIALLVSGWMWRQTSRRLQVDASKPGYARLAGLLMDPDPASTLPEKNQVAPTRPMRPIPPTGSGIYTVSIELDQESTVSDNPMLETTDLGAIDKREDRSGILGALLAKRDPVQCLVVYCQARRTPDQGLIALINQLTDAAQGGLVIALIGQDSLSSWGVNVLDRMQDWEMLAKATGGRVVRIEALEPTLHKLLAQ